MRAWSFSESPVSHAISIKTVNANRIIPDNNSPQIVNLLMVCHITIGCGRLGGVK